MLEETYIRHTRLHHKITSKIEAITRLNQTMPESAMVHGSEGNPVVDRSIRSCDVSYINPAAYRLEPMRYLLNLIHVLNEGHYKLGDLALCDYMNRLRYYKSGDGFSWHTDNYSENGERLLTCVFSFSGLNAYEGGELVLSTSDYGEIPIKLTNGELVVFPSAMPHKVTPVVSGEREVLVFWLGEN